MTAVDAPDSANHVEGLLNGLVVCVIDDSRSFSAGISELLESVKCLVQVYNDPKLAIVEVMKNKPDIIITDYEMGALSGIDVIRAVRSNQDLHTVPILVLTSRDEPEVLISTMLMGADSFASKSCVRDVLVAKLITLARVRLLYQEVIRLKQFTAIKTMVSTYKHEFGNVLAILDGKVRKLERTHPQLGSDESLISIKRNLERMEETLKKLGALKEYHEEPYSSSTSILRVA